VLTTQILLSNCNPPMTGRTDLLALALIYFFGMFVARAFLTELM